MKNNILKLIIIVIIFIIIIAMLLFYFMNVENNNSDDTIQNSTENIEENIQIKEKYECNEFSMITVTTENLINMYMNDYKNNMLKDVDKAYNSLNLEYRDKRFGDIENYKKYINENIDQIKQIKVKQYLINNYDGYDEYVCLDQYNNYYIFDVTAVMQYTLKLDTYTIDSQNFINAYDKASTQEKVMLNIQKTFNAINNKNYEYVYNKLDEEFKSNKYKNEEDFVKEVQNKLFDSNYISYNSFKNEGDIYIYDTIVRNTDNAEETKNLTVIMKLLEDRDYIMSYSFN